MKLILTTLIFILSISKVSYASEDVLEDANLYTVKFRTSVDRPFREDKNAGLRKGSGFLINKDKGLILTNAHITGRSKSKVRVAFKNYGFSPVKQVYVDPRIDIAIVQIDPKLIPKEAKEAKLKCNGRVPSGASVAAFGHPKGLSFSASRGIVSKYRFLYGKDVIQTDTAINKGNSGGPLIDMNTGLVIGVNKSSFTKSTGLSFAVPSKNVCIILDLFNKGKNPSPINLPIRFAEDREAEDYLKVGSFYYKGKNIEIGSSLIAVNDIKIKTPSELDFFLRGKTGEAKLTFRNNGSNRNYTITIKPEEKMLNRKYLYLSGAIISRDPRTMYDEKEKPFLIHSVVDGTEAELAGLWQHCWIKSVNGIEPKSLEEIKEISKGKKSLSIMTRCYASRNDIITEDFFVKLNIKLGEVTYHD
jgi:serine protease Do